MKLSYPKEKIKILLLEGIHPRAVEVFKSHGYTQVEQLPHALAGEELIQRLRGVHMLGIRSRSSLDASVFSRNSSLMAIGCFCIGTNQVDGQGAAERGIPVFNAPHSNTRSVAELVIGLVIMLLRGIFPKSMAAHRGLWLKTAKGAHEVRGKTIGIVGYGHIGSQVSVLAEALGMKVIYYDIMSKLPLGNAQPKRSLKDLLRQADLLSLHVPATAETQGLIGAAELRCMPKGSHLINASRGQVVDIEALKKVLIDGHLSGAALDVFPQEPKDSETPFESSLQGMDQVILSPHIGGSTVEAQVAIAEEVSHKLIFFSDRGSTEGATNFPHLNLSPHEGTHRLLHIHRNVPGVIQAVNQVVASEDINILGQYLQTSGTLGYVVIDVTQGGSECVLPALKRIEGTIRARILY